MNNGIYHSNSQLFRLEKITACETLIPSEQGQNNSGLLMEQTLQPATNNFNVTCSKETEKKKKKTECTEPYKI